ncbi:phosphoribosylamine--glycine ligase [Candidatus Nomurabacteria bacterium RIFCSPLOWO2_01_FULL_42_17]|uniref:Phosphoribosylamine--glycine ligase n=1 Tax=Candidatus Nomurabacteria bacterium RIFCSPLOWO2_01_FULL_42_17 TaxID=1801780 RepID=A0A1F6XLU1_9BACT|nr:MAG: phosphoribosylamine--glycine ligase [Candidatus Nomurabacteria bacterium RIFCSPLOWO2_01_FULL_42_17]
MTQKKQKILIIGGGGREHAIGWKVSQSPRAGEIFFAPGNGGTSEIGKNIDIKATDIPKLIEFAKKEKIDLTLALPDDPLALGIVDEFQKTGLRIWGPTKSASELEWSKAYAKNFMKKHGIPTAKYEIFTDFEKAKKYVETGAVPVVVKASGLALGKGVTVAQTKGEATEALHKIFVEKIFDNAGNEVVIEEYLSGIEISIHAISDGESWKIFPASQDHKRIFDGNVGPNTGGMGTIAPLPFVDQKMMTQIEEEIIKPAILGMKEEGRPFVGILYPGIMLTKEGPKVFEFNARFGDPETQTYMRLLDTDILDIVDASLDGKISSLEIKWKNLFACNIALASGGYPGIYEKGKIISGIGSPLEEYPLGGGGMDLSTPSRKRATPQEGNDIVIFHAGTKIENGNLVTNGGRVLGVSAVGNTLQEALEKAYKAIEKISFEGMQYRKDIGKSAR